MLWITEEAVQEVKRQALVELQRAVAAAETRACEAVASERARLERVFLRTPAEAMMLGAPLDPEVVRNLKLQNAYLNKLHNSTLFIRKILKQMEFLNLF